MTNFASRRTLVRKVRVPANPSAHAASDAQKPSGKRVREKPKRCLPTRPVARDKTAWDASGAEAQQGNYAAFFAASLFAEGSSLDV